MDDVDAQKRRVASLYDRVATEYDQMGPSIFAAIGERVVALANLSPGERVLDVACGRGANLFPAAQRVGPSGRAVGVDIAANMVHLTADDALRRGFSNVTTLRMDAERLEFADATFDMCFCSFAYFFFPHPDQAFAEIARVLTPEGRFLVTAHGGTDPAWQWYDDTLVEVYSRNSIPWPQGGGMGHLGAPEVKRLLLASGFADVTEVPVEIEVVFTSKQAWWASRWTHGSRRPLESLAPELLDAFQRMVFTRMEAQRANDGFHEGWRVLCLLARKGVPISAMRTLRRR